MNNISVTHPKPTPSTRVALITRDVILALDIGEALKSAGFLACYDKSYDLEKLEADEASDIRAAIVDLNLLDAGSDAILPRLAARRIPTIVISSGLEASEEADIGPQAFPNVIAHFAKPFVVDDVVPPLVSMSAANDDASDALRKCAGA